MSTFWTTIFWHVRLSVCQTVGTFDLPVASTFCVSNFRFRPSGIRAACGWCNKWIPLWASQMLSHLVHAASLTQWERNQLPLHISIFYLLYYSRWIFLETDDVCEHLGSRCCFLRWNWTLNPRCFFSKSARNPHLKVCSLDCFSMLNPAWHRSCG